MRTTRPAAASPWHALQAVAVLLSFAPIGLAAPSRPAVESRCIAAGHELYRQQEYAKAVALYESCTPEEGTEWVLRERIAMSYLALYHPGSTNPTDVDYADKAAAAFEQLLAMEAPDKTAEEKVRQYYVALLRTAGRIDKVVGYYDGLLKTDAQNVELMGQVAEIYAKKGDFDNAMKYYQKRTQVDPENKEFWYTVGVVCWDRLHNFASSISEGESLKTVDTGVTALEKALAIDKAYFEAYVYINLIYREKALVLASAGKSVEAGDAITKADEYRAIAMDLGEKRMAAGGRL